LKNWAVRNGLLLSWYELSHGFIKKNQHAPASQLLSFAVLKMTVFVCKKLAHVFSSSLVCCYIVIVCVFVVCCLLCVCIVSLKKVSNFKIIYFVTTVTILVTKFPQNARGAFIDKNTFIDKNATIYRLIAFLFIDKNKS